MKIALVILLILGAVAFLHAGIMGGSPVAFLEGIVRPPA